MQTRLGHCLPAEPQGNPTFRFPLPPGFPSAGRGEARLRGSPGLSLDHDGAGLRPPKGALVWGGGWGLPSPLPASQSNPTPPLASEARPGARHPP